MKKQLATPDDMGRALRKVWRLMPEDGVHILDGWADFGTAGAILERHMQGETTDDDRREVAKVLRELTGD